MDHDEANPHATERAIKDEIIAKLRRSPAHGVSGSEDVVSEWSELGCLLSTGSHLADMAASQVKRRIAKALKSAPWHDPETVEETTEELYSSIASQAVDDWENREVSEDDADADADDQADSREQAAAFLQSMVDGKIELLDETLADKMEPIYFKYENDPEMIDLFNRAAQAYSDVAIAAAKKALGWT